MSQEQKSPRIFVTPVGRLSFPALFVPEKMDEDGKEQYQATLLLPKTADLSPLKAMMDEVIKEKWGAKRPPNLHNPIRDGAEKAHISGYDDTVWFLRAKTSYRPQVVDNMKHPIDVEAAYAGCRVKFVVQPFAYEHPKGGKGVGLTLFAVQKVGDDEPFGQSIDINDWLTEEQDQSTSGSPTTGYDW